MPLNKETKPNISIDLSIYLSIYLCIWVFFYMYSIYPEWKRVENKHEIIYFQPLL